MPLETGEGSVKLTNITMEWTDDGAFILSTIPICCPVCHQMTVANVEHRCGDRVPKPLKRRARPADAGRAAKE
jgi:hypothetical protein